MRRPSKQAMLDAGCAIYFDLFIGKVFPLVSSGNPYRHNWHIDVVADALFSQALDELFELACRCKPFDVHP